ncbi:MAG: M48 family metallopeptidase [Hyphomicrobium sp.]|nr:M48 family metallopeptidase [Hyphomicrobium sp.]
MPSNSTATYGRFSDGRSASARDASVNLGLSGVEIRLTSPDQQMIWQYDTLKAAEPVRTHAIDVLLTSTSQPGASVFVPSPDFARNLRLSAPHLTARAERWRHARPWVFGSLAAMGFVALIYAAGWSPIRSMAGVLPQSWRERLGESAVASMTEGHKLCASPAGVAAMEKLSLRLSKAAGASTPYKVAIYDWPLLNAFAVPGGQVVMTKGLIEKAGSPDEVAGVLAHEIGHGIELHPETGIIRAIGLAAAVELMMGGSGGALANMGLLLAQLGYTRTAEHEADLQAITLLKNAAISNKGLGDFFKRVETIEDEDKVTKTLKPFDLLRTHPPTAEREKLVRNQKDYPSTPALDEASWQELKRVCTITKDPAKDAGVDGAPL